MTNQINEGRIRELVGDEHKFLWNPLSNVTMTVRIIGSIQTDDLKRSITKATRKHPLLRARVEYNEKGEAWFYSDGVSEPSLRVVNRSSDHQWQDEMMYENRIPMRIFEGPLIRFVLIHSAEVSDLMVFCQHSICDGRALVFLIRDILAYMADPNLAADPLPMPPLLSSEGVSDYFSSGKSLQKKLTGWIIEKYNAAWRKDAVAFDQEDFNNIHQAYWRNHLYKVETSEFSIEETEALITSCRARSVTVNSALAVAFLAAYREVVGEFEGNYRNVAIAVDLRNKLREPAGDVFCLYINRILFRFDHHSKESYWENVARFHKTARKLVETSNLFDSFAALEHMEPGLIDAMSSFGTMAETVPDGFSRYEKLSSFAAKTKNPANVLARRFLGKSPGLILTNLGKPSIPEQYGNLKLDRMFFAPSTDQRFPLVVGSLTAGGKLIVTLNYVDQDQEVSKSEKMGKISKRAKEILLAK